MSSMCMQKVKAIVFLTISRSRGLDSGEARELLGDEWKDFSDQIELVREATPEFEVERFLAGELTPMFFSTAMGNFGVREMLNDFVDYAPKPVTRETETRQVQPFEAKFSGFVFKIQANMDPKHRDRIALFTCLLWCLQKR